METDVHAQQRVVTGERAAEEATHAKKFMVRDQACLSYLEGQGMTQDELIEMAIQAGFGDGIVEFIGVKTFQALAKLVAEHEREACADIAENWNSNGFPRTGVAEQIRARGQA
jgi:hypothetical protein